MDIVYGLLGAILSLGTYVLPLLIIGGGIIFINILFRKVVPTNTVHIVQRKTKTTSYGAGMAGGNVYMAWPSWVPFIGITKVELPVNNFPLSLKGYEAYDKDRVPFNVDVVAFFRIADTNLAAQRVKDYDGLLEQLASIVQGAIRVTLARSDIHQIMTERATFGESFTNEVREQLKFWGVEPVKNMELMDIRDAHGSQVIADIMVLKQSEITATARIEVANNKRKAETAEIEARQAVDIRAQEAAQAVGERTAAKEQAVGIANEKAKQEIKEQAKVTAEKDMAVKRVATVHQADIDKAAQIIAAEQDKQTRITKAEGERDAAEKEAEATRLKGVGEAEANKAKLLAEADGERAKQMATVEPQIALAKEIGENAGYQEYLKALKAIEALQVVGTAQAAALEKADVKVIANTGESPTSGLNSVMDLFSAKGGTNLAAMLEAVTQSEKGQDILKTLGVTSDQVKAAIATEQPAATTPPVKSAANGSGAAHA